MQHLYKLLLFCLLMPNLGLAQGNLVPNGSFEDTVSCPFGDGDINALDYWFTARGTPDYFHPCANTTSPIVGVPNNIIGHQNPFNGMAYTGLYTYSKITFYREILGITLQQPTQIGTEYFVSAYVSRGNANFAGGNFDCATNKTGFRFSTIKYESAGSNQFPIDNFAHVSSNDIITDTIDWVLISGSFIADSTYSYLNIGNFFDDSHTGVISCDGSAYYYIDAVCVSTNPDTCDIPVGTGSLLSKAEAYVFPNPANYIVSIKNIQGNNYYKIINNTNHIIKQGLINESNNSIDISSLPNGMYFLQLGGNQTFKFIISH